jgi:hypothetical protein
MEQREIDQLTIGKRLVSPTPRFFKTIKTIGLTLLAMSGALLAAPVGLPVIVTTIAGYIAVAGTVATAVSQAVVAGQ